MKSHILIVDDDKDFLSYIKALLESKGYNIKTATNGKEALQLLNEKIELDLIISDIKMPHINGYELLKDVMENPLYQHIPFIFLSGLSSQKDIRLGKILGADDYITKPINEKDVLATIKGKLLRKSNENELEKRIKEISQRDEEIGIKPKEKAKERDIIVFIMKWDDKYGPQLIKSYPKSEIDSLDINSFTINKLGNHLFQAMIPIYGQSQITHAEDVLLKVNYINMNTYIYFDAYIDESTRSKQTPFMISVIAPNINYLQSLELKRVCKSISSTIKQKQDLKPNLKENWIQINKILFPEA